MPSRTNGGVRDCMMQSLGTPGHRLRQTFLASGDERLDVRCPPSRSTLGRRPSRVAQVLVPRLAGCAFLRIIAARQDAGIGSILVAVVVIIERVSLGDRI